MPAEILELKRPQGQTGNAMQDTRLDSFCKALLILKMFLKSSSVEIVVGVNNLLAAELITAQEARALGEFYVWELNQ